MLDLKGLEKDVERMMDVTERNVREAYLSYPAGMNPPLIEDEEPNALESKINEECLSLLLRERPFAKDLRKLTGIYKLVSDLERLCDHAYDVSWTIGHLHEEGGFQEIPLIEEMLEGSLEMLHKALESLRKEDVGLAEWVLRRDDKIDELYIKTIDALSKRGGPTEEEEKIDLYSLLLAKYAERVADHSSNLAEWAIYMATGVYKGSKII